MAKIDESQVCVVKIDYSTYKWLADNFYRDNFHKADAQGFSGLNVCNECMGAEDDHSEDCLVGKMFLALQNATWENS